MQKFSYIITFILGSLFFASSALAATTIIFQPNILPSFTDTYDLGTTTKEWNGLYAKTICLSGDCKTAWPAGGSGVWPFTTGLTNYGVSVQASTTPLWMQNGIFASSTSRFVYASTTALNATTLCLDGDTCRTTWPTGGGTPGGADTQVQFNNSGSFGGSSTFTWDNTEQILYVGDPSWGGTIKGLDATSTSYGGSLTIVSGDGIGSGASGGVTIGGAHGGDTGNGAAVTIQGDQGGVTSGDGGPVNIRGGAVQSATSGNGGDITFQSSAGVGSGKSGGDINFYVYPGVSGASDGYINLGYSGAVFAKLDLYSLTSPVKTFTLNNWSGTINAATSSFMSGFFVATSTVASKLRYASSTQLSATSICLTGDTCRTTWPTSGGTPGGSDTQVQFNNSGSFGGSSSLAWDNTNSILNIGTISQANDSTSLPDGIISGITFSHNPIDYYTSIQVQNATTSGQGGTDLNLRSGNASTTGAGGRIVVTAGYGGTSSGQGGGIVMLGGTGGATGNGGDFTATGGDAGSTSGNGGTAYLYGGAGNGSGKSGGNIVFLSGAGVSGAINGKIGFGSLGQDYRAYLDTASIINSDKTFTLNNWSGTITAATSSFMSGFFVATSSLFASQFPYASTTALSATTLCLTGDTCRTTWPTGGSVGTLQVETPSGTINGTNAVFTVTNNPAMVQLNGAYQTAGGVDYTLTGSGPYTITFVAAPPTNSVLRTLYGNAASPWGWPWSFATNFGTSTNATTTPSWFKTGVFASSTSQFTSANIWGSLSLKATSSALLATDENGLVVATTSIGTNLLTGILGISKGGTNSSSLASHMLISFDGTSIVSSSTPTAAYYIATSSTASLFTGGYLALASSTAVGTTTLTNLITKYPLIDVRAFGANIYASGSTNTAAFQAATTYACNLGTYATIFVPAGFWDVDLSSGIAFNLVGCSQVSVVGSGNAETIFFPVGDNDFIKVGATGGAYGGYSTFKGFEIYRNDNSTAGAGIHLQYASSVVIDDVTIDGMYTGILNSGSIGTKIINVSLGGDNTAASSSLMKFEHYSTFSPSENFIANLNARSVSTTYDYGIWLTASDGLQVTNAHIGFTTDAGLLISPETATTQISNIYFSNTNFDTTKWGIYCEEPAGYSSIITLLNFTTSEAQIATKDGVHLVCPSLRGFTANGMQINLNGENGFYISGGSAIKFAHSEFQANNNSNAGASDVVLTGTVTDVNLDGNSYLKGPGNYNTAYHISLGGSSDEISATNQNFSDATSGDVNFGSSGTKINVTTVATDQSTILNRSWTGMTFGGNVGIGTTTPWGRLSVTGSGTGTGINFLLANSNNTPLVTALDNGNVGIGTTTPGATLEVGTIAAVTAGLPSYKASINSQLSSGDTLLLTNSGAVSRTTSVQFRAPTTGDANVYSSGRILSGFSSGGYAASYLQLASASNNNTFNSELTISNTNVGVGSTSPYARLSIKGAGTGTGVNFQTTNSNSTPIMTVLDNGNVGVGTISPSTTFDVSGTASSTNLRVGGNSSSGLSFSPTLIVGTNAASSSMEVVAQNDSTYSSQIWLANSGQRNWTMQNNRALDALTFSVNGDATTYMTIKGATGKVGIGTTTPWGLLSVKGSDTSASTLSLAVSDSADTVLAKLNNAGLFTLISASTTNFSATGYFEIPKGTDPTVAASGQMAINTTAASTSIRWYDGTAERAAFTDSLAGLPYASSSLSKIGAYGTSGTTTIKMMRTRRPLTLIGFYCETDTGTAWVAIGNGSATSTQQCSTSAPWSGTSVTWTIGQVVYISIGQSASSPNVITVSPDIRKDAD